MHTRVSSDSVVAGYLANILVFTVAIILYRYAGYYVGFLLPQTQEVLFWGYILYLIFGLPFALLFPSGVESKGLITLRVCARVLRNASAHLASFPLHTAKRPLVTQEEKTALLFLLVKFFFLPVMLNFTFQNWGALRSQWGEVGGMENINNLLLLGWYPVILSSFFLVDTLYFVFGYAAEHRMLGNTLRSVDTTFFGWFVALICYPPFNDIPGYYVGWAADDYATFESLPLTYLLRIAVILSLFVYVWATVALGAKCSNLTNRGIVTRGPYAYVRHPAYVAKNFGWLLTSIPFLIQTGRVAYVGFSIGAWALIYFLRALTEERHLSSDPEYLEYCKNVRWRFIPYVF